MNDGTVLVDLETIDGVSDIVDALEELTFAADAYSADQADAPHPQLGLVQPVTVAEANALNEALKRAWALLTRLGREGTP